MGQEALYTEQRDLRTSLTLEIAPFGIPGSPDFMRSAEDDQPYKGQNTGLAVGYSLINADGYKASGPTMRIICAQPMIDTNFSAYGRWLYYENEQHKTRRFSYGLRADLGFSIFTGFVALGQDFSLTKKGTLEDAPALSFGIEIAGPISRIPALDAMSQYITDKSGRPYNE